MIRLLSVWYGADGSPYDRMGRVLEYTARQHHAHAMVTRMPEPVIDRSAAFRLKARDWTAAITAAEAFPGDVLCLLDTDTIVMRSLADIESMPFDLAVTSHDGLINSGVLFVRPSARVSKFFASWVERTHVYCNRNRPNAIRYGDQDALADMLDLAHDYDLAVNHLPMREWNSTQRTWQFDWRSARIVHVKSAARDFIFGHKACNEVAQGVAKYWLKLEKEALHVGRK